MILKTNTQTIFLQISNYFYFKEEHNAEHEKPSSLVSSTMITAASFLSLLNIGKGVEIIICH